MEGMAMTVIERSDLGGMVQEFGKLADPRCCINQRHLLVDILVISVLAVIAGADGPEAIGEWGNANHDWLKPFLRLPHGIPSHDTFWRVLRLLKPAAFQQCFAAWLASRLADGHDAKSRLHVAIDGKALRRSHDRRNGLGPLYLVSAWASECGVTLGQVDTEEKSNEITAIPKLLEQIDVQGAIVTIDAAGCQKNIANDIVEGGGDFVLALKGNQGNLYRAVEAHVVDHASDDYARIKVRRYEERETSHGREEHRVYIQMDAPPNLPGREDWRKLTTIGVAFRCATVNGKEVIDERYYINSLPMGVKTFARAVRGHWGIENTMHWTLDVTFREDENRTRHRTLADNLGWLRRFAIGVYQRHPGKKSMAMKRRRAGWDRDFLLELLTNT
jgi:predicted transposase YbfD/YdcC